MINSPISGTPKMW